MSHKRIIVIIYSLIAFILMSLSVYFGFTYFYSLDPRTGLIIGGSLFFVSIPLHLFGKKVSFLYYLSFLLNIIGIGFTITCYYVFKSYPLELIDFLTASGVSLLMLIGFGLISATNFYRRHPILYTSLIILVSFIVSLSLWINVDGFSGLTFYYLNVVYFFMFGMIAQNDYMRHLAKEMSVASFGAFILVSIIVLIIITEGEAIQSIELDFPSGDDSKREKAPK